MIIKVFFLEWLLSFQTAIFYAEAPKRERRICRLRNFNSFDHSELIRLLVLTFGVLRKPDCILVVPAIYIFNLIRHFLGGEKGFYPHDEITCLKVYSFYSTFHRRKKARTYACRTALLVHLYAIFFQNLMDHSPPHLSLFCCSK